MGFSSHHTYSTVFIRVNHGSSLNAAFVEKCFEKQCMHLLKRCPKFLFYIVRTASLTKHENYLHYLNFSVD